MPRRQRPTFDIAIRLAEAENRRVEVEAAAANLGLAFEVVDPHLGGGRWRFTRGGRFVAEWSPMIQRFYGRRQGRSRSAGVWGYTTVEELAGLLAELIPRGEDGTHAGLDAEMDRFVAQPYT